MPSGYDQAGNPLSPPTKQKTKMKPRTFRFLPEVDLIFSSVNNATAHAEHCVLQHEEYAQGGFGAHQNYLYRRIETLQAYQDQRDLTRDEAVELDWLNSKWDECRQLPHVPNQ